MPLELIKETIKVNQAIGQDGIQAIIENDIIVPDVKPDVSRILVMDGDICVSSTEVISGRMIMGGTIFYKILYVSDDPQQPVKGINSPVSFTCGLDIPDAKSGMRGTGACRIEHIDYEILNGRKINVKTILKAEGRVSEIKELDIANNVTGIEDIQILKENVPVNCFQGENNVSHTFIEDFCVPEGKPPILEILRNDVKVTDKEYSISDGRIMAKGILNVNILYIGDDETRSIQYMEGEAAFSYPVEMEDISDSSIIRLEVTVADSRFEIGEDSDGEPSVVNSEIGLLISAYASEKRDLEIIMDTYSPSARISTEKEQLKIEDTTSKYTGQVNVKENVPVNGESPDIMQVYNVMCKPVLNECAKMEDKILIEGIAIVKLIYLAEEGGQPIHCIDQEIPFKQNIDAKGINKDAPCDVDLDIGHVSYSKLSSKEVEIRISVNITANITSHMMIAPISKAADAPLDEKKFAAAPSITIYFTQPGDCLWKIAKKYYTTVGDIMKVNNIENKDNISPGQQVIIPKRQIF